MADKFFLLKYLVCTLISTFCFLGSAYAQLNLPGTQLKVFRTEDPIKVDGVLDESIWMKADVGNQFFQNFPIDTAIAKNDTEIRLLYDDDNLYVSIKCMSQGRDLITPSLRRDFDFLGNDNITILFDTYNDGTNAIVFGMTAHGVTREAVVSNAGQSPLDFDESWDNKWTGTSKIYDDHWISEMSIPFKTLRYTQGSKKWRMNANRYDTQTNEISCWIGVPRNRFVMDIGYMGDMIWEKPLEKTGSNVSLIPYTAVNVNRDFEDQAQIGTQSKMTIGGDAKIGISSGLNLDLTVNPDFSQVEVDQQVTNLDRFEIFFPERRQFFLENADLFGGFGVSRVNPFFSRRIGVTVDPKTGQNIQNKIHFGARLSGKLNDKLRLGLLNMHTASQENGTIPGFNFSVGTVEQKISKSSRLAAMFVNKQATNRTTAESAGANAYNRVMGLEYRLNTPDNLWIGKASLMKSFTPGIEKDDVSHFVQVIRNERKFRLEWAQLYIGNGFNTETGFTPRKDFFMFSPEASVNFFPNSPDLSQVTLGFDSRMFFNLGGDGNTILNKGEVQEIHFEPSVNFTFSNFAMINAEFNVFNIKLENDFDPTRIQNDGVVLPAGSEHTYFTAGLAFSSDRRKPLSYNLSAGGGSFYNGSIFNADGEVTLRYQPYGFVSLAYSYFRIALDAPFEVSNLWLIGPRIDLTFSKELFLTAFVQYNNQLDNVNINTRLQWRFAPVSDFFLVYTDNYSTDPFDTFTSRNRALVAKVTYWLNP